MNVSIVMAAKNYGQYIATAIESVIAQTHRQWELVIVDDGSTDETRKVVAKHQCENIQYHHCDRLGQSRAKNLGIRLCKHDTIAFLDADDAWKPEKLEVQLPYLKDDVGVVACGREFIDESYRTGHITAERAPLRKASASRLNIDSVFVSNPICFSSVLVKREVFDRCGLFDEDLDLAIDYDLWLRVAKCYGIVSLDDKLVLYRTGHANLSKKQADRIGTAFGIMEKHKHGISKRALHEGYGSTCQSMAWIYRGAETAKAVQWYLKAMRWPGYRLSSLKGIAGTLLTKRRAISPENQTVNY